MFNWLCIAALAALVACTFATVENKIVKGESAIDGDIPYQALLRIGIRSCGGVIISDEFVLTSAHCMKDAKNVTVMLGGLNAKNMTYIEAGQEIIVHPKFNSMSGENDIALVKLSKKVPVDTTWMRKIQIIQSAVNIEGLEGRVSGFGLRENGEPTDHLIKAMMKIIPEEQCKKAHPMINSHVTFCATSQQPDSSMTACKGDNGDPLVTMIGNEAFLMGIVSATDDKCDIALPDMFTRVSVYSDWIKEHINEHEKGAGNGIMPTSYILMLFVGVVVKLFTF